MQLGSIASLHKIPDGPAGIYQTLRVMRKLTREGKKNWIIRRKALNLVQNNGQKAYLDEIRDLHAFVRDRIRYVQDISEVETLAAPHITLEIGQGDCDDKCVLLASLLESLNHPTRFVALSLRPGVYSHVIVEAKVGRSWIPLETTEPVQAGWYPPGVLNRMTIYNR